MPRNPMLSSGRDAQNIGINTPGKSAEPHKSYIQNNNDFDLSYIQLATLRFADVHPFFVQDGLPADKMPFRSTHELRSYTLQSPMLSDIKMHKSFTMVPMEALLPNTWERFIVNPTKGDDIPDDVYCHLPIIGLFRQRINPFFGLTNNEKAIEIVKLAICAECLFSSGSLLSALKINFHSLVPNFDEVFDTEFVPLLRQLPITIAVNYGGIGATFAVNQEIATSSSATYVENVHDFLDMLRDGADIYLSGTVTNELGASISTVASHLIVPINNISPSIYNYKFDISRALAYQLSCITIMTDDSIDDIYTPALFRDMVYEYSKPQIFYYNDSPVQYDAFSENILTYGIENGKLYELYTLLFSFRKSLKFGDYFIDGRPYPYSVGDMSAEVEDGTVSAIDTTRSILAQRFLNWSNRVGNKLHDYILSLTGVVPTAKTTEPKYIIHEVFNVDGFEVENTGAEQKDNVSVTTQLKTQESSFLFDIELNDYCIVLGLVHFDIKRIYAGGVDRAALKHNRFDYFNKFFQYAGDQDIKRIELNAALSNPTDAMAYTTRHMQYKKAVSHSCGGFNSSALKSWAFVSDESRDPVHGLMITGINSDFIRNHNSELDRFYGSLTGYSLANYFHFICKFNNIVDMSRQMAIAPDIL